VLHNNVLDSTSWPLDNGAAFRFTTGRFPQGAPVGTINGTVNFYPPYSGNAFVWAGGDSLPLNAQRQFTATGIPAGPAYVGSQVPGYEAARSTRLTVPAAGSVNSTVEAWRLDPPREISAALGGDGFTTITWRAPESVEFHANPAIRYDLFVDGGLVAGNLDQQSFRMTFAAGDTVELTMLARYQRGVSALSAPFVWIPLGADEPHGLLPTEFALFQNYPNPFNPSTNIRFDLPKMSPVRLTIFNINGQVVSELLNETREAGRHAVSFDAAKLPSGLYVYAIEAGSFRSQHKMLLLK
jgi:hypothetical protein